MGLLSSIFSRKESGAALEGVAVEQARTRARRRLIGAAVLVGIGVVGFPLLFETAPRPIPVDVPIEIPKKDAVPPLALPAASTPAPHAEIATETKADAGREAAAPAEPAASIAPPAAVSAPTVPKVAAAPAKPESPAKSESSAKSEPSTKKEPPTKADKPAANAAGRMVVQVGAFADANAAKQARARAEKLGLKTYTQEVDTGAGKRIRVRVGPFASRDEADKAAGRLRSAGLQAKVLAP